MNDEQLIWESYQRYVLKESDSNDKNNFSDKAAQILSLKEKYVNSKNFQNKIETENDIIHYGSFEDTFKSIDRLKEFFSNNGFKSIDPKEKMSVIDILLHYEEREAIFNDMGDYTDFPEKDDKAAFVLQNSSVLKNGTNYIFLIHGGLKQEYGDHILKLPYISINIKSNNLKNASYIASEKIESGIIKDPDLIKIREVIKNIENEISKIQNEIPVSERLLNGFKIEKVGSSYVLKNKQGVEISTDRIHNTPESASVGYLENIFDWAQNYSK